MREPFSFGAPKRRRFAMQFGYDMRPTFWQGLRSNSHLVIAALGTAALLGVAAVALWLAMPASERQAVASPEQPVPAPLVKTAKVTPAAATAADLPHAAAGDALSPAVAVTEVEAQALAPNDPRWTGSKTAPAQAGQAASKSEPAAEKPVAAEAFADTAAKNDATTVLAKVAGPGKTATDGAQTAAIPTPKPGVPAAAQDDGQADAKSPQAATGTGRILRAVTMRAGPMKNAAAMVTIPARTSVEVMGCKQWCQIVYNGKRGWIYKSFVKPGA